MIALPISTYYTVLMLAGIAQVMDVGLLAAIKMLQADQGGGTPIRSDFRNENSYRSWK